MCLATVYRGVCGPEVGIYNHSPLFPIKKIFTILCTCVYGVYTSGELRVGVDSLELEFTPA